MINRLATFVFVWFFTLSIYARIDPQALREQYRFSHITIEDGLLHNYIDDIYKDSQGFLWLSTSNGLSRYDGYDFVHYHTTSEAVQLKSNFIRQACEDNFNRLWIASEGGVDVLDLITNRLVDLKLPTACTNQESFHVRKDCEGNIWIVTLYVAYCVQFTTEGEVWSVCFTPSKADINHTPITAIEEINGRIWIAYQHEIYIVKIQNNRELMLQPVFRDTIDAQTRVQCMFQKGEDVWVGTNRRLYCFNMHTGEYRIYRHLATDPFSISQGYTTGFVLSPEGELIVATLKGLNFYDPVTDSFIRIIQNQDSKETSLNCNFINSLLTDGNTIWIGTEMGGVNKMVRRNLILKSYVHNRHEPASLAENPVNAIYEDKTGNLWVGNTEGGLNLKRPDRDGFIHFTHNYNVPTSLSHNSVSAITEDNQQRLWIGTWGGGLNVLDLKKLSSNPVFKRYDTGNTEELRNDFIGCVQYDELNNGIWIGSLKGLHFYDNTTETLKPVPLPSDTLFQNSMVGITIDSRQRLWIGTSRGLICMDLKTYARNPYKVEYQFMGYKLDDPGSKNIEKINCIYEDKKGTIWVGSLGYGLYKLIEQPDGDFRFINITTRDGLPSNGILGILEDEYQQLWLSTNYGLACYHPGTGRITNYYRADGILSDQFYWNAYYKSPTSRILYFGNLEGLIGIEGVHTEKNKSAPKVVFTQLTVLNEIIYGGTDQILDKDISRAHQIRLHEKHKSFSLAFSALDFENLHKINYLYRLKGFDTDWVEAGGKRHFVNYTNLNPGTYTFQVKVAGDDPGLNEITELVITIKPYFYKTWWFISGIAIAFIVGIFWIYLRRISSLEKQKEVLTRMVKERTRELEQVTTDKIAFFTNITHEFRTPITLIMGPIERALKLSYNPEVIEQLNIVEKNSKSLLSLVNQLLDFRKVESGNIKIHKQNGVFISFLENMMMPFEALAKERKIEIRKCYRVTHSWFYFDEECMRKVFINLLSNAIKFTPDNGTVTIYIAELNCMENGLTKLYINISDTGMGIRQEDMTKIFDRFYQSKKNVPYPMSGQSGTGIGLYLCKSIVEQHGGTITARNNPGKGASFRLILPLQTGENSEQQDTITSVPTLPVQELPADDTNRKTRILVVEDNPDMRVYLRSILKKQYHVEEAGNGKEALAILADKPVDFILTDLMMPVIDGMELSRKVKENISTSHIPILILTAKISTENKIESFKIGVDEYLSKPFEEELLLVRISNILNSRKQQQKQFEFNMDVSVLQIDDESKDKKFLDKVMQVMEENYKNPEFKVPDFSVAMAMSKSLVNRKLQQLTGQFTGKFIRSYRLNLAKELIIKNRKTRTMNVSEIAYQVGFNGPKYFTRCFREHFGTLPKTLMDEE